MAARYKLQDVAKIKGKDVFIDANILIYLFWPTGSYKYEENYARVFGALLKQGNNLFADFLVISEIINRVLRIEHQKIDPAQKFKEFRNSADGKNTIEDIYTIVKNEIIKKIDIIGKEFDKKEIESLLVVEDLDFVDKATVNLCKENSLVLLTNDKDFKDSEIDILTGNPNILK